MGIKRLLVAVGVAVAGAAVLGATPTASADVSGGTAAQHCWSVPAVAYDSMQLWSYTHTVSWCGDKASITLIGSPQIVPSTRDATCAWLGVKDQRTESSPTLLTTFSMGEFACAGRNGVEHVTPWVFVTAYPNGSSQVETGVTTVPLS
jgi:hypothetical protein